MVVENASAFEEKLACSHLLFGVLGNDNTVAFLMHTFLPEETSIGVSIARENSLHLIEAKAFVTNVLYT